MDKNLLDLEIKIIQILDSYVHHSRVYDYDSSAGKYDFDFYIRKIDFEDIATEIVESLKTEGKL